MSQKITTENLKDFYCTYTAIMPVSSDIVDRTYQGEMDVRAEDESHAAQILEQNVAKRHPGDRVLSSSCKEFPE